MTTITSKKHGKAWEKSRAFLLSAGLIFALCACSGVSQRQSFLTGLVDDNHYNIETIETNGFRILFARPVSSIVLRQPITIVIEGDGFAWQRPTEPSDNPTPLDPTGFRIAALQKPPAYYLARPCQYVTDPLCNVRFWTQDRFAPEVIQSYNAALDHIAAQASSAPLFHLIGYSGGAYVATALAASRNDIASVTSVAGVIDVQAWTAYHDITPLRGIVPASTLLQHAKDVMFRHICAGDDKVSPCVLTKNLVDLAHSMGLSQHEIEIKEGFDHADVWRSFE